MKANLDMFAYLAAFVTVVLALAVSDMLQSLHRLLRARGRVRWSLIAMLAAVAVLLAILEEFFALWRLSGVRSFTYYELLLLLIPPILLALAALTVLPDEVPAEGIDLGDHYMAIRRMVYALLALWALTGLLRLSGLFDAISGRATTLADVARALPWEALPLLVLFGLLAWARDRRVQLGGLVVLLVLANSALSSRSIEVPGEAEAPAPPAPPRR